METQSTSHGATRERSETKPDHSRQYSGGLGFRGLSDTHWSQAGDPEGRRWWPQAGSSLSML